MYRTIEKTHALLRQADPETAITKYFIRKLAAEGKIHALNIEKKILIDVISLQNFLGFTIVKKEN